MILFRDAVAMVNQSPALAQRIDPPAGPVKNGTWHFCKRVLFPPDQF